MVFGLEKFFTNRQNEEVNTLNTEVDDFENYDFDCDLHLFHYGELEGYLPSFDPACLSAYVHLLILISQYSFVVAYEIVGYIV